MKKDRKTGFYYGNNFISSKERKAVSRVMKSQSIFRYYGPNLEFKVNRFEKNLGQYFDVSDVLCTSSGTAALKCALKSLNVKYKDEIIIPAYGFVATANAVVSCNAIPIFCDVDDSMNIDANKIEELITTRTKAIICVHIGGESCNLGGILKIAKKYNIQVIEDTAQSFGGKFNNYYLGTFGDIGCFSFQAHKILSTGEGGCVVSNEKNLIDTARIYHDQGGIRIDNAYPQWNDEKCIFGENYRMSEITAAIGIEQLKKIPYILKKLKKNKKYIMDGIKDLGMNFRQSWDKDGECSSNIVFYVFDDKKRDVILNGLKGINAHKNYDSAVYENYLFQHIKEKYFAMEEIDIFEKVKINSCGHAELLSKSSIWIPIDVKYTNKEMNEIIKIIRETFILYEENK